MIGDANALQIGLALGVASILSIGPNNIALMREGLVRGRVGLVVSVISGSLSALLVASWWLASSLHDLDPTLRAVLSWTAVGALLYFALQSFLAAGKSRSSRDDRSTAESTLACVRRILPIVWLNPLSYLEFLFVPAAIVEILDQPGQETVFLGTVLAITVVSNMLYGFGGQLMSSIARGGRRLRFFDVTSGAVLCVAASLLAVNLYVG